MDTPYAGDVTASECWAAVVTDADADAFVIDVRTSAEWSNVGVPELPAGRKVLFQEWQVFPSMAVDPGFAETLAARIAEAGGTRSSKLYFLCRSGVRSMGSAAAMTTKGFEHCFNILDGFEGPANADGHRGTVAGWKAEGLAWGQR